MYVLLLTLSACPEEGQAPPGAPSDTGDTDTTPEPSPYASCTSTAEYDDFADGIVDSRHVTRFDANGAVTREEIEMRADGTVNFVVERTNDDAGHALEQRTDANADGTVDLIDAWTYDADGNMVTWAQDEDADGTPENGTAYTYDEGFLQRRDQDENYDGDVDHVTNVTWVHGATDIGVHTSDEGLDGEVDFRSVYEYATSGSLLSQEVDWDADGVAEMVSEYAYDEAWVLQQFRSTYVLEDGESADTYDYFYDDAGRVVLQEYDVGDDGILDGLMTFTYDCP